MFKRLFITPITCAHFLAWCRFMKANFQMLASLLNKCWQIEIERVFDLFCVFLSVLTTLKCCRLKVNNLGRIITMVKNLPNDLGFNFSQHKDLTSFMKV